MAGGKMSQLPLSLMELLEHLCHVTLPSIHRNKLGWSNTEACQSSTVSVNDNLVSQCLLWGNKREEVKKKKYYAWEQLWVYKTKGVLPGKGGMGRGTSPQNKHHSPAGYQKPDLSQHGPVLLGAAWPLGLLCQPLFFHEWSESVAYLFFPVFKVAWH